MNSVPLAELADVTMGQSPDSTFVGKEELGLPFLQGSAEFGRISPTSLLRCARPPRKAKAGSILISVRAPVGQMNAADQDYCIGRGLGAFAAKPGVANTNYLKHAVEQNLPWLHRRSQGSTFAAISADDLRSLPVSGQSPKRQDEIAAVFAALDAAINGTEALIEKHQQIKAGLVHDLFTRGIQFDRRLRQHFAEVPELFQQTALGPLPREWRRSTVGESFGIDSGITLGPHRRPTRRPRKYLRVANVHRDQLRLDDVASIETLPGDEGYALRERDLLVVEGHANPAEIGRCAMVDHDTAGMLFQNHLFRLRAKGIDSAFALLWLNSFHVQRYWERNCSTSSGLHTINRRMLKAVPIFVPSESEQLQIVSTATSARARLDSHKDVLAKLRAQKLGLMQDLLTGKVRVPLPDTEVTA